METIVISRHIGLVQWLVLHGHVSPDVTVVAHATPDLMRGRKVIGVIPMHLACHAKEVWSVDLPNLPLELRGKELTPEQMDQCGANLVGYKVMTIETWNDIKDEVGVNYY